MNEEKDGRTIYVIADGSSLSTSECTKIRYYANMFAGYVFPALEIGSYIGSSTVSIGIEYKAKNNIVYSIDHHRGSEEHQKGGKHFEESIFNEETGLVNTFDLFRTQVRRLGLEKTIIPIVSDSDTVAKYWNIPLSFLFIDGDHSTEQAIKDVKNFAPYVAEGGLLGMHDVNLYRRPEGSQHEGPRVAFFDAIRMGFTPVDYKGSLVFLRKGEPEAFGVSEEEMKEIMEKEKT